MELLIIKTQKILVENIKRIFNTNDLDVIVDYAKDKKFGDFQTNFAMINSKKLGMSPRDIATKLIENFKDIDMINKLEIAGPGFINIFINEKYLSDELSKLGNEKILFPIDKPEIIAIDYSSPNIAKRMHVGHLRSTIIGDSLKRILRKIGHTVIGDNHIGDWGTQFGKLIVAYNKWLDKEAYEENAIEELERLYVKFSQESKNDPELEVMAREELRKVQSGDEVNIALWQDFIRTSLKEYDKVYERLNIEFELYNGESFYNDRMPEILEILKEKGIAILDGEALVVFFDEDTKLHPCIVQKKDGSFLYSTSDLATIKYRKDELNVDRAIYVVDARQAAHFKQVFGISKLIGAPYDYEKVHTMFGIMRFGDGMIFSSRGGNIIRLVDLLDEAKKEVRKIIEEKNPSLSDEEKEEISEIVGTGAIKYFDLSQNRETDVLFSWDKVLNFDGNTGPYLQYTYVRMISIMNKVNELGLEYDRNVSILNDKSTDIEKEIARELLKYPYIILKASELYKPNFIAEYLFNLSKLYNNFYANVHIINSETKEELSSRLLLIEKIAYVIKDGLRLLGIYTVDKM